MVEWCEFYEPIKVTPGKDVLEFERIYLDALPLASSQGKKLCN